MTKGYYQKSLEKMSESIYLVDRENNMAYTFSTTVHKMSQGELIPCTDIAFENSGGLLRALAEALQMGGYIPNSANDAELKATKYHLEDMRSLVLERKE